MKFPYFLLPGQPRNASTPLVKVVYKYQAKRTTPMLTLVDSGAQVSFAPLDLAIWLGVSLDKKKQIDMRGFNNAITTYYPGRITIEMGGRDVEIPVYFGGPSNLHCILGQDPFFDFAKITFEKYSNSFSIDWVK